MFKLLFVGPFQMGGGHAKPEIRVLEAERRRRLAHLRAEEFPGGCAGEAEFGQNLAAAADPAAGFGDGSGRKVDAPHPGFGIGFPARNAPREHGLETPRALFDLRFRFIGQDLPPEHDFVAAARQHEFAGGSRSAEAGAVPPQVIISVFSVFNASVRVTPSFPDIPVSSVR